MKNTYNSIINFAKGNDWFTWLTHSFLAMLMQGMMALVFIMLGADYVISVAAGAVAGSFWYHGREKVGFERKQKGGVIAAWYKGWLPWQWGLDGFMDWFAPTSACTAIVIAFYFLYGFQ